jgi:hypothetical protein
MTVKLKLHTYFQRKDLQMGAHINPIGAGVVGEKSGQGIIVINQDQEIHVLYPGLTYDSELRIPDILLSETKSIGRQDGCCSNEQASSDSPFEPGFMNDLVTCSEGQLEVMERNVVMHGRAWVDFKFHLVGRYEPLKPELIIRSRAIAGEEAEACSRSF